MKFINIYYEFREDKHQTQTLGIIKTIINKQLTKLLINHHQKPILIIKNTLKKRLIYLYQFQ
jgi:hypothetical protein